MRWLLVLLALLCMAEGARADELRPGYLEIVEQAGEGSTTRWRLAWRRVPAARIPGDAALAPRLPDSCRYVEGPRERATPAAIVGNARAACIGSIVGKPFDASALLDGGDVVARFEPLAGEAQTQRLTLGQPAARLEGPDVRTRIWRSYLALGWEHILEGWDHLLFVIALVLLVRRWQAVALAVTAFTLAHSVTLAGVTLGLVGLPGAAVEAVIALSIVLLAVEIAKRREDSLTVRYPWAVAFGFGLIHGFGFAGALAEIGLPEGELWQALLAFNLGVEFGQLAIVAATLLLLATIRLAAAHVASPAIRVASYAIGITGAYWLIERLAGMALSA